MDTIFDETLKMIGESLHSVKDCEKYTQELHYDKE